MIYGRRQIFGKQSSRVAILNINQDKHSFLSVNNLISSLNRYAARLYFFSAFSAFFGEFADLTRVNWWNQAINVVNSRKNKSAETV